MVLIREVFLVGALCVIIPFACKNAGAANLLEGMSNAAYSGKQIDESETRGWSLV